MNTAFEHEIMKIRVTSRNIESSLNLITMNALGPFDLTAYDLRQTEKSLRRSADMVAELRIKVEMKEREEFRRTIEAGNAAAAARVGSNPDDPDEPF